MENEKDIQTLDNKLPDEKHNSNGGENVVHENDIQSDGKETNIQSVSPEATTETKTYVVKKYPEGTHKEPYKIGCTCEKCVDYKAKQLKYREERKAKKEKAQNKTQSNANQNNPANTNNEGSGNGNTKAVQSETSQTPSQVSQDTQQVSNVDRDRKSTNASQKIDDDLLVFQKPKEQQQQQPQQQPQQQQQPAVVPQVSFSDFVSGHMLLMALDYSFPFIAKNIYGRFVDKRYMYLNKKGIDELKLTKEEKRELEKSADELVKLLFKDIPPQYAFLILYGMICVGKISMLDDRHFDLPPNKN